MRWQSIYNTVWFECKVPSASSSTLCSTRWPRGRITQRISTSTRVMISPVLRCSTDRNELELNMTTWQRDDCSTCVATELSSGHNKSEYSQQIFHHQLSSSNKHHVLAYAAKWYRLSVDVWSSESESIVWSTRSTHTSLRWYRLHATRYEEHAPKLGLVSCPWELLSRIICCANVATCTQGMQCMIQRIRCVVYVRYQFQSVENEFHSKRSCFSCNLNWFSNGVKDAF